MSKVAITGNASGSATFTIAAPNTDTDRTLTLPDSAGTIATAESTLAQFSASGSAPVYACRAWVNFNGTGTVAIRASGNVTSITDNGTGDYTVNFTAALSDANYAITAMCGDLSTGVSSITAILGDTSVVSASSCRMKVNLTNAANNTAYDASVVMLSFFR